MGENLPKDRIDTLEQSMSNLYNKLHEMSLIIDNQNEKIHNLEEKLNKAESYIYANSPFVDDATKNRAIEWIKWSQQQEAVHEENEKKFK